MTPNLILLLMFGSLTLFMLTGLPIAFVLGGLSLLFTVTLWEPGAVIVLVLQIFDTMKSEALLAIPLFILMACILQRSGSSKTCTRPWKCGLAGSGVAWRSAP